MDNLPEQIRMDALYSRISFNSHSALLEISIRIKIQFDCFLQPLFGAGDFFTSPNYPKCKLICTSGRIWTCKNSMWPQTSIYRDSTVLLCHVVYLICTCMFFSNYIFTWRIRLISVFIYIQISKSRSCWDSFYKFDYPKVQINLHFGWFGPITKF